MEILPISFPSAIDFIVRCFPFPDLCFSIRLLQNINRKKNCLNNFFILYFSLWCDNFFKFLKKTNSILYDIVQTIEILRYIKNDTTN